MTERILKVTKKKRWPVGISLGEMRELVNKHFVCEYFCADDDNNTWQCDKCGNEFEFYDGYPSDNQVYYCPKCGFKIAKEGFFLDEDYE